MARRRKRSTGQDKGPAGFLVVDKPSGWTSHDVVDAARGWLGTRQIGHLGTLDRLATGVLPLAVRGVTKLVSFVAIRDKTYVGSIRFGEETDTLDAEGAVIRRHDGPPPDESKLAAAMSRFLGDIEQVPPMYSAVKKGGVPLHRLARQGQEVEREPKKVRIDRFELIKYAPPIAEVAVDCSAGTYVRTLAADLGALLGCGAHLAALRRTRSAPFVIEDALSPTRLAAEAERGEIQRRLVPAVNVLGMPVLRLRPGEERSVLHGIEIPAEGPPQPPGTRVAALGVDGELVAVLELRPGRRLHPLRNLRAL